MANLTSDDIKKGVLKGTNKFDEITIDSNYSGKKVTVKADKGNDRVYTFDYAGDLTVYAGMGADVIATGTGKNTLYGESGTNTFEINPDATSVTISAGVGKAIIDVSSFASINDSFFSSNMNAYFERNGNDLVMYPKGKNETNIITIKGFYKQRGEILLQYEVNNGGGFESKQYDLRDLNLTTYLSQQKSANYTGGRLNETIEGDDRRNTIKGGDGNDVIYGWGGNDKLYGENGSNSLFGGDGDDTIYGGAINDLIDGGVGNNKLYGKQGDNTYIHGGGNDTIYLEKNSNTNLWLDGYLITDRNKKGNDLELLTFKDGESGSIILKNFFKLEGIADTITVYETDNNSGTLPLLPDSFQVTGKGTIKGTAFDDYILGSTKADKIYAIGGEDEIYADKGNDKIYSGEANPTLRFNVGDGKDTLYGNFASLHFHSVQSSDLEYTKIKDDLIIKYSDKDSVTLSGYFANNSFVENIQTSDDFVELGTILESYNNKLEYNYGDGTVKFYSMPDARTTNIIKFNGTLDLDNTFQDQKGNDLVISQFGAKNDKLIIVDYFKNGYDIQIEDSTGSLGTLNYILDYYFKEGIAEQGVTNGDFSQLYTGTEDWRYTGTYANDNVTFGSGNDSIKTGSGHDVINAGEGDDTVRGGSGNDEIYGGDGENRLYGDAGDDIITSGADRDTIYGGDGNDRITSGANSDEIYGGNGNDYIDAGDDFDTIDGGAGNDEIYGGYGDDTIKGGSGNDIIYGDAGNNTIYGGKGNDHIYINSSVFKTDGDLVHGDAGNDIIEVETGSGNRIYGDAGDDSISVYSGATNNKIYGGAGHDWIDVADQQNKIYAGSGNDSISISTSAVGSYVDASSGNDIISISADNVSVEGGSGSDAYIIDGNSGVNLDDSSGNDLYMINSLNFDGTLSIDDEKGKDTLKFMSASKNDINIDFNIRVNSKGKIVDLDDVEVKLSIEGQNGVLRVGEYFDDNCIERIETADGYYITKSQMQNVAQEVASWLVENNYDSVNIVTNFGNQEMPEELAFIYENINWQH